jgi:hypothetical protein
MRTLPQMARPSQAERIKAARDAARELDLAKQRVTVRCAHCSGRATAAEEADRFSSPAPSGKRTNASPCTGQKPTRN